MAKYLKNTVNTLFFWYTAFSQLFEKHRKHDTNKFGFFDPNFDPSASESWLLGCFGTFLGDVENSCFFDAVIGWQKIKKSRLGAPKGRQGDFAGSAKVPFSDFWAPGRPQYQRSKYISI